VTEASLPSPILTYSLDSEPSPIQVKTPVTLTFVVSGLSAPDDCTVSQIQIQLPVGSDASDATNLTAVTPRVSDVAIYSTGEGHVNWTRTVSGVTPGLFIFTPSGGPVLFGGQGLRIEMARIQVNPVLGTAQITITEWAAPAGSSRQVSFSRRTSPLPGRGSARGRAVVGPQSATWWGQEQEMPGGPYWI
jgi:hypothetical protein